MSKPNHQKNSTSNLKIIFFDVGDTLYTSEDMEQEYPRQLQKLLVQDKGITIQDAERIIDEEGKRLKGKIPHVTKVAIMESLGYTRSCIHEAFNQVNPEHFLHEDKELQRAIKKLKSHYKLGIITNFQRKHTKRILRVLGISIDDFEYFIGEEDVKEIKPSLEPFLTALRKSKIPPDQMVYVADSITKDLLPAKQAGIHTIWVGGTSEKVPHEHESVVDYSIENIHQLEKILSRKSRHFA